MGVASAVLDSPYQKPYRSRLRPRVAMNNVRFVCPHLFSMISPFCVLLRLGLGGNGSEACYGSLFFGLLWRAKSKDSRLLVDEFRWFALCPQKNELNRDRSFGAHDWHGLQPCNFRGTVTFTNRSPLPLSLLIDIVRFSISSPQL